MKSSGGSETVGTLKRLWLPGVTALCCKRIWQRRIQLEGVFLFLFFQLLPLLPTHPHTSLLPLPQAFSSHSYYLREFCPRRRSGGLIWYAASTAAALDCICKRREEREKIFLFPPPTARSSSSSSPPSLPPSLALIQ